MSKAKQPTEKQIKYAERSKARSAALANGDARYVSNTECPKGHVGERYAKHGACCQCAYDSVRTDEKRAYDRARYQKKKEEIKHRARERHKENPWYARENAKKWAKKNKEKVNAIKKNYKAKRRSQERSGVSGKELNEWVLSQKKTCYWCGIKCANGFHIDHYEPLAKGGFHELDNLVIACETCNVRKSAKDPYEFAQEVGRLL